MGVGVGTRVGGLDVGGLVGPSTGARVGMSVGDDVDGVGNGRLGAEGGIVALEGTSVGSGVGGLGASIGETVSPGSCGSSQIEQG